MNIGNYSVRDRILGGLFGKAVGGTLGQPLEGLRGPSNVDRYTPEPTGMIPNDDLDLQILWMCKLATDWKGVLSRRNFAETWVECVHFYVDEYAVAIRNIEKGIMPPMSGVYDNAFRDGLGAAIRSEIWAFLAPGDPDLAVKYARYDAEVDHCGDGLYAELFFVALESIAFVETDIMKLIERGLQYIPAECRLAQAVRDTVKWCAEYNDPLKVRRQILLKYGSANFTDVVMNIPFMILALVLGKGVFGESICMAANCGRDADCTAATVGAILGIIDPDCIEEKWLRPIGRDLVVSKEITGINPPATLDEFTDLVMAWQGKIICAEEEDQIIDWSKFEIKAQTGVSIPKSRGDISRAKIDAVELTDMTFKGNLTWEVDLSDLAGDSFRIYEMKMHVPEDGNYAFIVASTCRMLVWLNNELQFGHCRGDFVPSTNRPHINQNLRMPLKKGTYQLSIALSPYDEETTTTPLFFALADSKFKFVLGAFDRENSKKD